MSRAVETFAILDLDRTLVDTDELFGTFIATLRDYPEIDRSALEQAATEATRRRESFDPVVWVRERLEVMERADIWHTVKRTFIAYGEVTDFLLPGARELLQYLDEARVGRGILTYGGREWQQMKLEVSGLADIPTIITDDPAKGTLLKRWQQPNGQYELPAAFGEPVSVRDIVFIDDKLSSFVGTPEDGMLKLYVGPQSDGMNRATDVQMVKDLYEARRQISQKLVDE